MLISNGWTDDLFPADEAIRFYNRTRTEHPARRSRCSSWTSATSAARQAGRPRPAERSAGRMVRPLPAGRGAAARPRRRGAHADVPQRGALGRARITAADLGRARPGRGHAASSRRSGSLRAGAATRRRRRLRPARPAAGPARPRRRRPARHGQLPHGARAGRRVHADGLADRDRRHRVAGRDRRSRRGCSTSRPTGRQTLVARGIWRPATSSAPVRQVFQLHPNGWRFAEGHVAKLELLPKDPPYAQASNSQAAQITVDERRAAPAGASSSPERSAGSCSARPPKVLGRRASSWPATSGRPGIARPQAAIADGRGAGPAYRSARAERDTRAAARLRRVRPAAVRRRSQPDGRHARRERRGAGASWGRSSSRSSPAIPRRRRTRPTCGRRQRHRRARASRTWPTTRASCARPFSLRITDRLGRRARSSPATVQNSSSRSRCRAHATAERGRGSGRARWRPRWTRSCPGAVAEGRRAIWQLGEVEVQDGGTDGLAATDAEHAVRAPGPVRAPQGSIQSGSRATG